MNSRDYWKRRSLNLEQLLHTRAEQTVAQITGLYDKAQENIVGQIEKAFSAYAKGGAMNEKTATSLLTVRETEEARDALREQYQTATGQVKRDIWARLSAPAYANRISRLQALRDDIYAQARRVGLEEVAYVSDRLTDTLEQSYYRTIFDVEQYTGEGYRFDLLGDNQISAALSANWSGKNWSDRLWDNNQRFADAVEETITVGLLAGLRYDEMRDNLLAVVGLDDTQGAKYNARRLVMTECSYVANQGHLMGYQAAGIEYYIYLATLDLRTSEICRKLDGQRFPVAEAQAGTNLPPMHPHCRSTTMCDMSRGQLCRVNRAARDPVTGKSVTIPGYMTYKEWYEKYVSGDNSGKGVANVGDSGIIESGGGSVTINSIDSPIEQRNTSRGKPGAILHYDVELNTRQQALLDSLQEYDSRVTISKTDVSMADLSALTAKTGDEFAMFTKAGERLIVRGNSVKVNITPQEAQKLNADGYTWSGHTHPGTGRNCLIASQGDVEILKCFGQLRSCIYNSAGEYLEFWKE